MPAAFQWQRKQEWHFNQERHPCRDEQLETGCTARGPARMKIQIEMDGELRQIELIQGEAGGYRASIDGEREIDIEAQMLMPGVISLQINGKSYRCVLEESVE